MSAVLEAALHAVYPDRAAECERNDKAMAVTECVLCVVCGGSRQPVLDGLCGACRNLARVFACDAEVM